MWDNVIAELWIHGRGFHSVVDARGELLTELDKEAIGARDDHTANDLKDAGPKH